MQYYRCKCGRMTAWGSMPPRLCESCPDCNTTLAQSPEGHREPEPHQWVTRYDEYTGEPYEICINCLTKKKEEKE